MDLPERFRRVVEIDPDADAVEYAGRWHTWGELGAIAHGVTRALDDAEVEPATPVAWIARNHPAMIGAALGIIGSCRMLAPVSPHQPAAILRCELEQQRMAVIVAAPQDWLPEVEEAARATGALGLELRIGETTPVVHRPGLDRVGPGPHRAPVPGVILERITSGTTGAPKRIPADEAVMRKALALGARSESGKGEQSELVLPSSPAIQFTPFAHSGGLFGLLLAMNQGRKIVLHERFDAQVWSDAVRRYQAKAASLVPTMIKMVMDADIPPDALGSILAIRAGTAPLDPDLKEAFETRFGVPILVEYGASEFVGGVAGWSLADHKRFHAKKRGSVGRPRPDVELRVVDGDGEPLPVREVGTLHIKCPRFGPDWVATTDLAALDEDGFLYIHGRADEAIIRGGFKVLPEKVAEILRQHPAVRDAAVLGIKDERLGQAPLAVIEPQPGQTPTAKALTDFARAQMPSYDVPVAFEIMAQLPRTVSMKVARPALRAQLSDRYRF